MRNTYSEIFDKRGLSYHMAMLRNPNARRDEFEEMLTLVAPFSNMTICDAPSGGCFLRGFITDNQIKIIAVDSSSEFFDAIPEASNLHRLANELNDIDLPDCSVDRVVSLAGLHHITERQTFFHEACRITKRGGALCIADVRKGSPVDSFLNIFVDRHNSMGHRGDFLDNNIVEELEACGFRNVFYYTKKYFWHFENPDEMAVFCKLLFGIDKASEAEVLRGIEEYLGYQTDSGACHMNWELLFARGEKLED